MEALVTFAGPMHADKVLEQQIAVFGEGGSGKTVMLSSFYGAAQEPAFKKSSLFHMLADDIGQGTRLHKNYLGMRDSNALPMTTRLLSHAYSFTLRMRRAEDAHKSGQFNALRLVWHDYPGEWFEEEPATPEEADERVRAFRKLLGADVALLLIDGQRLLDNTGEEERYLRLLFSTIGNALASLKDDLLPDGEQLIRFPRIWVLGLSKADLLPDMNVYGFRDLVVRTATDDLQGLRDVLSGFVVGEQALSVGEDFVLLSSARFSPNRIDVDERIGVDLVMPLAAMLPLERHARWVRAGDLPRKLAEELLKSSTLVATVLAFVSKFKLPGPAGKVLAAVQLLLLPILDQIVNQSEEAIGKLQEEATKKKDFLAATLLKFRLDLADAEKRDVLIRSGR